MNPKMHRQALKKLLPNKVTAVLCSGSLINSTADLFYPFEVNRNFYYLTGIIWPNVVLTIEEKGEILWIEKTDPVRAKWIGGLLNKKEAALTSGIKDVRYLDDFALWLKDKPNIVIDRKAKNLRDDIHPNPELDYDLFPVLAKLRSVKSEEEIAEISKAIRITHEALDNVLAHMKPGMHEYEYAADFLYILNRHQSPEAFESIVAGGPRATILHNVLNNSLVKDGELCLFDVGATAKLYCADISRTYPVNGKFTNRQKEIYQIVLDGQDKVFDAIRPGITTGQLNQILVNHYEDALKRAKVIKHSDEVREYYYHGVSHSLGLDCHDVGITKETPLVPGMVITVEPGLYLRKEGIGIRIEDDALVTKTGSQNLSEEIPKRAGEIEERLA